MHRAEDGRRARTEKCCPGRARTSDETSKRRPSPSPLRRLTEAETQFKTNRVRFANWARWLPRPSAATTAPAAGRAAPAEPAGTPRARRRGCDRVGEARVHRLEAAGQKRGLERSVADRPAVARARVDSFEGFRPARDAAEDDRVGQELGEDLGLLGELLPVFLGRRHVKAEPKC